MKHPIQPLQKDERGVMRFKTNHIVRYLLDQGGIDMNDLDRLDFPDEDREQFAQLIGYSLDGFSTLGYVSDITYVTAEAMANRSISETEARIIALEEILNAAREGVRVAAAALFKIHPDDLEV